MAESPSNYYYYYYTVLERKNAFTCCYYIPLLYRFSIYRFYTKYVVTIYRCCYYIPLLYLFCCYYIPLLLLLYTASVLNMLLLYTASIPVVTIYSFYTKYVYQFIYSVNFKNSNVNINLAITPSGVKHSFIKLVT